MLKGEQVTQTCDLLLRGGLNEPLTSEFCSRQMSLKILKMTEGGGCRGHIQIQTKELPLKFKKIKPAVKELKTIFILKL